MVVAGNVVRLPSQRHHKDHQSINQSVSLFKTATGWNETSPRSENHDYKNSEQLSSAALCLFRFQSHWTGQCDVLPVSTVGPLGGIIALGGRETRSVSTTQHLCII